MATQRNHQNNFATNLTSNQIAGVTTTPLNSIPSVAAPFSIALDATNLNGKYEVVEVTSKTATNINHAATTYAHTTAEEVRMVVGADELDEFAAKTDLSNTGWRLVSDTWTYASADAPTFTITVPSGAASLYGVGMRIKLNQTTDKYFIITAVADTVLTVYGGTDYTLANAAISSVYVSPMKAPLGFPLDPTKWTVKVTDTASRTQGTPTQNTWYNLGSVTISVPIGAWNVDYQACGYFDDSTSTVLGDIWFTLSTANNTESDKELSSKNYMYVNSAVSGSGGCLFTRAKHLVLASKTSYFLNEKTSQSGVAQIVSSNDLTTCVVRAVCAYL